MATWRKWNKGGGKPRTRPIGPGGLSAAAMACDTDRPTWAWDMRCRRLAELPQQSPVAARPANQLWRRRRTTRSKLDATQPKLKVPRWRAKNTMQTRHHWCAWPSGSELAWPKFVGTVARALVEEGGVGLTEVGRGFPGFHPAWARGLLGVPLAPVPL